MDALVLSPESTFMIFIWAAREFQFSWYRKVDILLLRVIYISFHKLLNQFLPLKQILKR